MRKNKSKPLVIKINETRKHLLNNFIDNNDIDSLDELLEHTFGIKHTINAVLVIKENQESKL